MMNYWKQYENTNQKKKKKKRALSMVVHGNMEPKLD
jgi:hypothetical protein